jgi:hypothetical protein
MTEEEGLKQAIALIKAGKKNEAVPILKSILKTNRNNELAWLWLSTCADKQDDKIYCFQEALRINPNNEPAKKALEQLKPQFIPRPTVEEMGGMVSTVQSGFSQNYPQPINPLMNQAPISVVSNQISTVIVVLLIIMGLFWLVIGFLQVAGGIYFLSGVWNIIISIINLAFIRDVVNRSRKVVNNFLFLGIVGGIWGFIQLISGAWLQAFAIPIYIALAVLAQTNKEYFSN